MGQPSPCFCKGCKASHKSSNLQYGNNAIFIMARMRMMNGSSNFKTETLPNGGAGNPQALGDG
jgi:hypothetical protein